MVPISSGRIAAAGNANSPPPPSIPDLLAVREACTHKHARVRIPHTARERAGMEPVPDFIGGDSSSHFSVWITSSSWAMRGNEHCSTTKSRFRLTELVLKPVGCCCRCRCRRGRRCCCCTAPPPDRTPTTAARDWCVRVCVYLCVCRRTLYESVCVCMCERDLVEPTLKSGREGWGGRERCVRLG